MLDYENHLKQLAMPLFQIVLTMSLYLQVLYKIHFDHFLPHALQSVMNDVIRSLAGNTQF